MEKIGYYEALCNRCGESYNGYSSHRCPPETEDALKSLIDSAMLWMSTFSKAPERGLDAKLYESIQVYNRAKAAEAGRKKYEQTIKALCAAVKSGKKPARRPKSLKSR